MATLLLLPPPGVGQGFLLSGLCAGCSLWNSVPTELLSIEDSDLPFLREPLSPNVAITPVTSNLLKHHPSNQFLTLFFIANWHSCPCAWLSGWYTTGPQ